MTSIKHAITAAGAIFLLTLLFIGVAAKADVPRHVAKNQQQATIDSLQHQLAIAQSEPYNQGFQAGYKAGTLTAWNLKKVGEQMFVTVGCIALLGLAAILMRDLLSPQ